jgi:hypothetical protein
MQITFKPVKVFFALLAARKRKSWFFPFNFIGAPLCGRVQSGTPFPI